MRLLTLLLCCLSWSTAVMAQGSALASEVSVKTVATGFDEPVGLASTSAEPSKLFVVERGGLVRVLEEGKLAKYDLLDIEDILSPEENPGLSSIAFPNDYATNRFFYVSYTDKQGDTIIGRFPAKKSETADEEDLMVVLKVVQPHPHQHRSYIAFGPDGYLYIALGDAPRKQRGMPLSQNPKSLFGKVLRIDLSDPQRYKIPSDNPFAQGTEGAPEVWALGFQQPTHLSFDFQAKRLFLLDSAQKTQVIDLVERGKNYGGATTEGGNCSATKCDTSTSTRPIYSNAGPVIGGFVYTSDMRQGLKGSYVFAEGTSMTLSKLTYEGSAWKSSVVAPLPASVAALGKNERGDIYVATRDGAVSTVTP